MSTSQSVEREPARPGAKLEPPAPETNNNVDVGAALPADASPKASAASERSATATATTTTATALPASSATSAPLSPSPTVTVSAGGQDKEAGGATTDKKAPGGDGAGQGRAASVVPMERAEPAASQQAQPQQHQNQHQNQHPNQQQRASPARAPSQAHEASAPAPSRDADSQAPRPRDMVSSLGARGTDLAATAAADERPESREWPSETDHRRPASTKASHTHLKSALSPASNPQQQQQQQQPPPKQPTNNQQQKATTTAAPNNAHTAPAPPPPLASTYSTCKRRRLSYAQSLLLRKWPYLAVGICIMGSLLFGILLSALTVYLTSQFGSRDCSALAERLEAVEAASRGAAGLAPLLRPAAAGAEPPGGYAAMAPEPAGLLSSYSAGEMLMFDSQQSGASGSGSPSSQRPQFQRLPSSVWPQHYDLFVQPHIAEPFTFDGRLAIKLECRSATDNITLHTNDLAIDQKSLKLRRASSTSAQAGQTTGAPKVRALLDDRQLQYSIVQLDGPLEAGAEYVLEMNFTGNLNDDLAGFYKIKYQSVEGRTVWIAATQFQATDARRAFPCFDEPLYKATFSIQIKHWKNMTALSNMPIIDRVDSPDGLWVTDTFAKSHKMSTYLVAYAVTNFESRSQGNISVWTRPGFTHTAEYALEIAGKILRYYEEFFGIEYPLPKMDMIALPDFNAGAMENWGLITYRETAMLFDANYSSLTNKQRISVVVAHELAHQWFGNLVTPKWWDDLWLNEGFASYVEYLGVDHVAPKWRMLDQFAVEEVQNVFKLDALPSSHQISIPVNNPDEISEIFDHISYAKGASIIRMMKHFLEKNVFETGLRRYLRALRYSNAEQSDLWRHLTEAQRAPSSSSNRTGASHKQASAGGHELVDVEKVMNSWTLQTGFPLVTLKRHYSGQARDFSAELSQVRYKPHRLTRASNQTTTPALGSYSETERWEVPITYTWSSEQNWEPKLRAWMHQNETAPVKLSGALLPAPDDEWVLMNVNQVGYYRVNYDIRNWKLLIQQLLKNHTKIGPTNRAQIIDDMFELARSAMLDYDLALEATTYLVKEHDNLPWDSALLALSYVDDMLERTPLYGDWRDFVSDLIAPYYSRFKEVDMSIKLGKQQNASADVEADVLEQENQVSAINWACHIFDECISRAKHMFREWRSTGVNKIDPAFRYTIYCTAIENGNKDDWDFLWAYYEHEQNASERDRIMKALGCTKQIWLLARYLEATFSKNTPIRRQDGTFVFRMIARNNYGRDIAFNFMRERWQTIKEHYGKTSFSLGHLIRSISLSMNTHIELNQLVSFYESIKNDVGSGKRSFQIAIEEVETNVLWKDRNYAKLERWLGQWKANKASKKNRLPAAPAA